VHFARLVGRGWSGITGMVRPRTAAALFRRADRYRNEGRYDEAARLVAEGLQQAPDSSLGHLLSAYLHVAAREMDRGKTAFHHVLALDRYHPRALLGLARISLEEQDLEASKDFLDQALRYYADFPEARALRDLLDSWSSAPPPTAPAAPVDVPDASVPARDLVLTRTDGTVLFVRSDEERGSHVAQHLTKVYRMASAALSRAGLGPLRRGAIATESGTTFILSDGDTVLSATLEGQVEIGAGLAQVGRLWPKRGAKEYPA
jgi:tetratricopeptide (TPR) repeat protein